MTWRLDGPGWCLSLRVARRARAQLVSLLAATLVAGLGSCTGTVQRPAPTPSPTTPTSSSNGGTDVGPQTPLSEPPSATVRFFDLHTREGSPCPSGTVERSCG
jgi:hypothetical protein